MPMKKRTPTNATHWSSKPIPRGDPAHPSHYFLIPHFFLKEKIIKKNKNYILIPEGNYVKILEK